MSEEADFRIQQMVVCAAASAAGPIGTDMAAWQAKVGDLIPQIASMVRNAESRPMQRAAEVLTAEVFVSEYRGYDLEESSTRCVVHLWDPNKDQAEGDVRTHRTDERAGRVMRERLNQLKPGDHILVYKAIEATRDPNKKVRILVHFDQRRRLPPRGHPNSAATDSPAQNSHSSGEEERPPAAGPPVRPGVDSTDKIADALNALSAKDLAAVATRCRAEGLTFPNPQSPHERHRVEAIIDGVVNAF